MKYAIRLLLGINSPTLQARFDPHEIALFIFWIRMRQRFRLYRTFTNSRLMRSIYRYVNR